MNTILMQRICPGFSKSFKVDGEFFEVGGRDTDMSRAGDESPLLGDPPENFEILNGRRCNLGIYLRKMKLLIGLKNAGFQGEFLFLSNRN